MLVLCFRERVIDGDRNAGAESIAHRPRIAPMATLKESFASLRLCTPTALMEMRLSMAMHGQLTPVTVYDAGTELLEVIDGFKRVHAARELGLDGLRIYSLPLERAGAKVAMLILNASQKLSEIEEGWLIRSLHREDRLSQPEIGRRLHRNKSWVFRRLLLVESLDEQLQTDLRLGLLRASAAREVARLPRGNQREAATVIEERGLTTHQSARLVQKLLTCVDGEQRQKVLREIETDSPSTKSRRPAQTRAEQIIADIAALTRIGGRLHARLLEGPLAAHGDAAAILLEQALAKLDAVLSSLGESAQRAVAGRR